MFGIGMLELVVILVLATIVLGPEKMVEFAGDLGRWLAKFRAETSGITREFRDAFDMEINDIRGELNEFQRDLSEFKDVEESLSELEDTLSAPLETGQPKAPRGARPAYNLPTGAAAGDDAMARFQAARQERQQQTLQNQQQRREQQQAQERPTAPEATPVELQSEPESIQEVPTPEIVRDLSPDAEAIEISVELVGEDDEIEPMVLDGPELMEDPFASEEAQKDNGSSRAAKAEPAEVMSGPQTEDGKEEK